MAGTLWWNQSVDETVQSVSGNADLGLSSSQVERRQVEITNVIGEAAGPKPWRIILDQFTDTMVLVLLGATVVSGIIGDMVDAITIMTIVIINAVLGFIQEYKAERSLEEIKKLAAPYALVLRDGKKLQIAAADLVVGDLVMLEAGDKIPADLRVIASHSMEIDESALTGESVPVEKRAEVTLAAECPLADRINMAFMGTAVTRGRGSGIVIGIGMQTVMGEIAGLMREAESGMTPLQLKLDQLGKILIIICLLVCSLVAGMGIWRGEGFLTMFMAGISLAVAAIPEGLPAIVTVVLALGVQRMAKRNAIVRKLPAVETLGCTTVICSDKTGTLTRNQMTVKQAATLDQFYTVEGEGYQPRGKILGRDGKNFTIDKAMGMMLDIALNCNNSELKEVNGHYEIQGDPTEGALLVLAAKGNRQSRQKVIKEIPFDSDRKRMSVVIGGGEQYLYVKGALDIIIDSCHWTIKNGQVCRLAETDKRKILQIQAEWANQALRVLCFAYRHLQQGWENLPDEKLESDLVLVGICGMMDPPRPGAAQSVKKCLTAGIIPVMITGDHPLTAAAIAKELGIAHLGQVVTGEEINRLSDESLYQRAMQERVFARVSPQHKNRIVNVLKERHQVVAMTGDGVNDAPAIKAADIGIAMGISGTQVTKEASAMILMDDDFSTIVQAVYEGRAIYDNIRKFIRYLLGCNIGEVLVMFMSSLLGLPLPMLPIQLLWVNLVTDGLPAMALGVEPPEPGIMNRKPRPKGESIFAHGLGWIIFSRGTYIAIITIASFLIGFIWCRVQGADGLALARSMAFTTLVLAQLFYVFECRSERYSPFELGFATNRFLLGAVLCSVTMQVAALYVPFLQSVFKTVALDWWQWAIIIILAGAKLLWRLLTFLLREVMTNQIQYVKLRP